jgi:hypothetical protein
MPAAAAQNCPCSIWATGTTPGTIDGGDASAGEYGMRFQATANGYITAISFYKAAANTGIHIGNLWSNSGTLLATVTFTNETASGWQQANLSTPVAVTAGTSYVASYFTPSGHYSFNANYFTANVGTGPVEALADGTSGANGVYAYSSSSTFPTSTYGSSNYWIDVSFNTVILPTVVAGSPVGSGVSLTGPVTATFNEPLNAATVNSSTFELFDPSNALVSASVSYIASSQTAVLQPSTALLPGTTYTAVLVGGSGGIADSGGNPLSSNYSWSFTTQPPAPICPCSLWSINTTPGIPDAGDGNSGEYGVKFKSDVSGNISALRFYKGLGNIGTHVGHVWTSTGSLLATATFSNETASGWQQVTFNPAVPISANTTYIASYFSSSGHYADTPGGLQSAVDDAPLHAISNVISPNGVYYYAATSTFPSESYYGSNYWVDVVFLANGSIPRPKVVSTTPLPGNSGASYNTVVSATLNEPLNSASVTSGSIIVVDSSGNSVAGSVTYDPALYSVSFQPTLGFAPLATYTATLSGSVADASGNSLGSNYSWSFTIGPPPANSGPGGPILVIASILNPFTHYYDEILRAEGLNEFTVADITTMTPSMLSAYDVAILGDMSLTSSEVSTLANWVTSGGKLIAMHPDPQLASLLGLTYTSQTMTGGYLLINTSQAPGFGITGSTMQYHGPAELFTLNGASPVAMLYSTANKATAYPAVTQISVGAGTAAAFTFDLARSVVYTRQGNPAWSGEQRDSYIDPTTGLALDQIRTDDLFYGNAAFDPEPDYVDLSKALIPQADEQQRLLVNMILSMAQSTKPLPRFWYLPSGYKAAVVMTGDDHNQGGTVGRFQNYAAESAPNCSVPDWQCIRATSYIWPGTPISVTQATNFVAQGFELSFHPDSSPTCSNWTPAQLADMYTAYLESFASTWPGVPAPVTVRTHCISWSDYDTQPQVELQNGIRLDTNYYYWPDPWVQDRPGFFTGSALPQRFADRSGNTINVYQATTQFPDETTWTWPNDIDTVLGNATGPLGYYGVFTTNMHTDYVDSPGSDAIIASAKSHGIPVVSAVQMLNWLDGRNTSTFSSISWHGNYLSFTITPGTGARNLVAMLPTTSPTGPLGVILLTGNSVTQTVQIIKGVTYAVFNAAAGSYQAYYGHSISGTVTGTGGSGITVSVSGAASASTTTDASGNYAFGGLINGVYTVTPTQPGYIFTPQVVTYSGTPITGVNFTGTPVALQSITVLPNSVTGGASSIGTVTLNGPAPSTGAVVTLSSTNSTVAAPPASVAISSGATSANFTITTHPVANATVVGIGASYKGSFSASLTVNPPQLSSFTLNPTSVTGGTSSTGTVRLTGAAPSGGLAVILTSNNAAATVPASVSVSSGQSSATFSITTKAVSTTAQATIGATLGTVQLTATLTVSAPQVRSVTLSPAEVVGGVANSTGTITLTGPAPAGGAVVTLANTNSLAASVPGSVTVAANGTTAAFTVSTNSVTSSTTTTITATFNGSASAVLKVDALAVSTIALSPASVVGGNSSTGTVTLNAIAPASVVVTLSSNNGSATVPASATILAGRNNATFTVTTSPVSTQTRPTITGTYGNSASSTLTITPPQVQSLSLSPSSVTAGSSSTATVTLNGPAPSGGIVVTLSSSNTAVAQTPVSLTVPANATSATFTITTTAGRSANVTISARGVTTATAILTVHL